MHFFRTILEQKQKVQRVRERPATKRKRCGKTTSKRLWRQLHSLFTVPFVEELL